MLKWLLTLLIVPVCLGCLSLGLKYQKTDSGNNDKLRQAFTNSECANPCWLGIEVGVTSKENTINDLQEHNIEFTTEGYDGSVIWLYDVSEELVPGRNPEQVPTGNINIGAEDANTVQSIDFELDLCVSTIIDTYGIPEVWHIEDDFPGTLVYLEHQLFFSVQITTQRIDGVYLHMKNAMPSPTELQDWSEYADRYAEACSDVFTERMQ